MSFTFCTSAAAVIKAGLNVNSTIVADTTSLNHWSDEIESLCCDELRYDAITNFASMTANGKEVLQMICTSYVAQQIINYEPEALGTSISLLRLNVLENSVERGLKKLRDKGVKEYLEASSG